jgi:hypothetical protein
MIAAGELKANCNNLISGRGDVLREPHAVEERVAA